MEPLLLVAFVGKKQIYYSTILYLHGCPDEYTLCKVPVDIFTHEIVSESISATYTASIQAYLLLKRSRQQICIDSNTSL